MQSDLTVDMHAEEATKYQQIKSVCKQLLSGWSVVPDSDIEVCVPYPYPLLSSSLYRSFMMMKKNLTTKATTLQDPAPWLLILAIMQISCISGGISNALYSVKPAASCNLPQAVFRIYGDNTEKFVDRHKELEIMPVLHNHGFGPAVSLEMV